MAGTFSRLRRAITTRQARLCVVGQGYVGVTVAAAAASAGMEVDGVDRDLARVAELSAGRPGRATAPRPAPETQRDDGSGNGFPP